MSVGFVLGGREIFRGTLPSFPGGQGAARLAGDRQGLGDAGFGVVFWGNPSRYPGG